MESFYGGRQGISFIIVKRFDGINIPKDTSFTVKYFAFDTSENGFILDENNNPIERTNDTYKLYNDWKTHEKDGSSITYKEREGVFPFAYAEGMVQCFSQGGITTDIVNYGEYVIIDTPNKNDLDNGKVYRRGLDYQNDLGGAEYIGQIVGPTGSSPEIYMDSFTTIINEGGPQTSYEKDDVIPGMELNADGQMIFNDAIHSSWITLKDEYGNVTECKIGFQFPYHVFNFTAEGVSPYTTGELIERIDDMQHPYYSKWKISVPKGIKGDAFDNLHIVNSVAKKDIPYYEDIDCTIELGTLSQETPIEIESEYYTDEIGKGKPILESGVIRYVKEEDGDRQVLIYKEITFDKNVKGDISYIILGEYNIIKNIALNEDGTLIIEYTYGDTQIYQKKIKWIKEIKFDKNKGQIIINFNTGETQVLNKQEDERIQWINNVDFDKDNGQIILTFNTGEIQILNDQEDEKIKWIKDISFNRNTGQITLTFNTGEVETLNAQEDEKIKWIDNVDFDKNTGQIILTFNTGEIEVLNNQEDEKIKWIDDIILETNGKIKVKYNLNQNNYTILNDTYPLKWINDIQLTPDGKLEIIYNTEAHPTIVNLNNSIKWIENVTFADNEGIIRIIYNTEQPNAAGIKEGIPLNTNAIKWLTQAKLTDKGEIKVKYNLDPDEITDTDGNITVFDGNSINENDNIRWIKHDNNTNEYGIKINTNATQIHNGQEIDLGEGSGSQKIQVTYNTGETHEIGKPINYIIESIITKDRELLDNEFREGTGQLKSTVARNNHLLVIYSDPAYRKMLYDQGKCKIWKSDKLNQDQNGYFEQWYDMGEVRGEPGTVKIATTITPLEAETLLVDGNTPEIIFNNEKYEGWLIGVQEPIFPEKPIILYYYDYDKNKWKELGSVTSSEIPVEPEKVIQIESTIEEDLSNITVEEKGIVFVKDKDQNVIINLKQRNEIGLGNPCYFGSLAKYVFSTLNAGVNTLEQQLLIGFNKITEEWVDENGNTHIKTKFLIDESTLEYYILHSIIYTKNNEYLDIAVNNSKIIFNNTQDQNVEFKGIDEYNNNYYNLNLNNLKMYSINENGKLAINPRILTKEDILSICMDGIEENAINLYKKQTIIQTTSSGHKFTQEKIIELI